MSEAGFIQKIDVYGKVLLVAKLGMPMSNDAYTRVAEKLKNSVRPLNCETMLLSHHFDVFGIPDEETMNKLGWIKKGKNNG